MTDADGAVDSDYDDALQDYRERVADALDGVRQAPMPGGIAIDLVTRQPVFVRECVAETCAEYYDREGFDLVTYKMHPWLPGIGPDNAVYECVYLDGNPQNAHSQGKTYDFPEARLMHYPIEISFGEHELPSI